MENSTTAANPAIGIKSTGRRAWIDLFMVSFITLFFEVLVIRWMAEEVRIFSYFKNITLIACFLGLGLGSILARKRVNLFNLFMPLLVVLIVCVKVASLAKGHISYPGGDEHFLWGVLAKPDFFSQISSYYIVVAFFFVLCAATFVPLGQRLGRLIRTFPPIKAYTINIFGSLMGIWGFSALCFAGLGPFYWFALGAVLLLWLARDKKGFIVAAALGTVVAIYMGIDTFSTDTVWSPYYRIDIVEEHTDEETGEILPTELRVNKDYHQKMLNLKAAFIAEHPEYCRPSKKWMDAHPQYKDLKTDLKYHTYNLPYIFHKNPGEVLIVGAGTGNDVAAALRQGATHIDAVDIDPTIQALGKKMHPERPYDDPRVTRISNDARTYFKLSKKKYDTIIFGLLDSHTVISNMSSLRLDNYIYTLESFKEARSLLKDEKTGVIALSFSLGRTREWIGQRLYEMLTMAFEREPLYLTTIYDGGILYMLGPDEMMDAYRADPEIMAREQVAKNRMREFTAESDIPIATDDWPNLYLKFKSIPQPYLFTLVILLVLSATAVLVFMPKGAKLNMHFLFLGVAFMLIEVKSINELALLYGSTWLVNAIVISAIMITILLANLFVSKAKERPLWVYYLCLLATIVLGYFLPVSVFLQTPTVVRLVGPCVLSSLPILFAGIIFATSFKHSNHTAVAFGSNLLGGMGGGMLEYSSIMIGIRSLFIVAGGAYLVSFLARVFKR